MSNSVTVFEVICPCCSARLTVDGELRAVIAHEAAKPKKNPAADHLERAKDVLEQQAEQREARFRESAQDENKKSDLLSRKFEEALKRARNEPITRPDRDIDLD
jgi:hypothetical protein